MSITSGDDGQKTINSSYDAEDFDAAERFWLGPRQSPKHVVYHMQRDSTQQKWLETSGGIRLDPNYSEFAVRVHDPKARSLSFIYRTICVLPKSKIRAVVALLEEYLNDVDNRKESS